MIDLTTIIISACTGSLAATFVNYGYAWWYQPNLEVDASAEGCIVRNFPQSNNRSKKFLRLRIFNAGRTTAKNVQIVIPKIYMVTTPKSVIQGEVFDAKWSSFEALQISIPSKTPRFADLCACIELDTTNLEICASGSSSQLHMLPSEGKFAFEIYITAENAKTVMKTVTVEFSGSAQSLRFID